MPGTDQDVTPVDLTPDEDTGRSAADEFADAATAVTKNRQLPDQVRRDLAFREKVRDFMSRKRTDDTEDGNEDGTGEHDADGDEDDDDSERED